MRSLADENFPVDAVAALVAAGHVWVHTIAPGSSDEDVLAQAAHEERVLLTFDKDFGELAWQRGLPPSSGVVLFRMPMPTATRVGAELAQRITERSDWRGHFSVVEPGRIRMRAWTPK
jgi:predicted nuclease of predicted toxin-antitoxin system